MANKTENTSKTDTSTNSNTLYSKLVESPTTNSVNAVTNTSELPPNLLRQWQEWQRKLYLEKFFAVDFYAKNPPNVYWRWQLKKVVYQSPIKSSYRKKFSGRGWQKEDFAGNDDLKIIFHKDYRSVNVVWEKLTDCIRPTGVFVPAPAINRLPKERLLPYLQYLKVMNEQFSFVDLLKAIKSQKEQPALADVPLTWIALWEYFQGYAKFLKSLFTKNAKVAKTISKVLAEPITTVGLSEKMPLEQLWLLIQSEFQVRYFNGMSPTEQTTLANSTHSEVQKYWQKYADSIRFIIENGYPAITKRSIGNRKMIYTGKMAANDFYRLAKVEQSWVKVQEIIDPYFSDALYNTALDNTRWAFRPDRPKSTEKPDDSVAGGKSILDRIKENGAIWTTIERPNFAKPVQPWLSEESQKWYDFNESERVALLEQVEKDLSLFQQRSLDESVLKRWNLHQQNFGNQVFGPFLYWTVEEEKLIPQWNVLPRKLATKLVKDFQEEQLKEAKERMNLAEAKKILYVQENLADAKRFVKRIPQFSFSHLQNQWSKTVKAHLASIQHKGVHRLRRMREFGMLSLGEKSNKKLDIWLDELLLIEKEIGPYIPFVKKAFLMALPEQTSTEFDPYRHSHDGIEFDPETTQDQHKWLRGEVMKTLRVRTGKADAEQINAFALDFSGSMRHQRMRNLFKILYLMVMGLEDRKSYDAFHFFGSNFIETVNFSDKYTNRSLLFQILRQIARIDYQGIRYGGLGGTNMSEGIIQCHQRVKAFTEVLQTKYPQRFFLKSIFVITDGEPSLGIHIPEALNLEIERLRKESSIAIKGIYLRPKDEKYGSFMERIFGKNEFVETDDFAEAINRLVFIMTQTYKQQRIDLRQQKIREKYERSRNLYQ